MTRSLSGTSSGCTTRPRNSNTDSNGAPTSDGVQHLREAADAWNKYVKATNGNLSPGVAVYALNVFDLLARIDFSSGPQRHEHKRGAH